MRDATPGAPGQEAVSAGPRPDESQRLVVGCIRGFQGLKGVLRVEVLSDEPHRFRRGATLYLEGDDDPLHVASSHAEGPGLLVRFRELRSRAAVNSLLGRYLEADVPAVALAEGAFYWHELNGSEVVTREGEVLGRVEDVFRAGGGEVFVVRGGPRGELYVPLVSWAVPEFTPRQGRIVVEAAALDLGPMRARRPRGRRSSKGAPSGATEQG